MTQSTLLPTTSPRNNPPPYSFGGARHGISTDVFNRASLQNVGKEIQDFGKEKYKSMRPWSEFFDKTKVSQPSSVHAGTARMGQNLVHYQANYILIALVLLTWTFISNFSLLCVTLLFLMCQLAIMKLPNVDGPIPLFNGLLRGTKQTYQTLLIIVSVPLFWYASAGSALVWLLAMVMVVCLGHAVLMEPVTSRDEFGEEP